MGKSKKVTRQVEREVFVAFEDGDKQLVELASTVYARGREVQKLQARIAELKEECKAPQKALTEAQESLEKGKPTKMSCTETVDYGAKVVVVVRDDTGEEIHRREMVDADYQSQIGDEEAE